MSNFTAPPSPVRKRGGADLKNIVTRTTSEGTVYQVRVRVVDAPTLTETFSKLKDAQKWRDDQKTKVKNGEQIQTYQVRQILVETAINDYLTAHKNKVSDSRKSFFSRVAEEFEGRKVSDLTTARLQKFIELKLLEKVPPPKNKIKKHNQSKNDGSKTYAPSTIKKWLSCLQIVLKWHAKTNNYKLHQEPFVGLVMPTIDDARDRRLTLDEEEAILKACEGVRANRQELKTVIQFAIFSAMRMGEITKILWTDVDDVNGVIQIRKEITKTKKARAIPIGATLKKLLETHKKTKTKLDPRIFWQWQNSHALTLRFKSVIFKAKIENYRFHDLRHEAISRFFENTDLDALLIAKISGHSDINMLSRYANLRLNFLSKKLANY